MNPTNQRTIEIERTTYHDNVVDRLFIWLFSRKMANVVGDRPSQSGYEGFVELSRQIMRGRTAREQQAAVAIVLKSLVPRQILYLIRTLFSPTRRVCELNAWFATRLFEWLVGPCEVQAAEIQTPDGQLTTQNSAVHIKKCRYLDHSRCVGMCINMCKLPTQTFFTQEFGIPVTMTPNFDDFSCTMTFGQVPPDLRDEPVYHQPCLVSDCSTARGNAPVCPKLRDESDA